MHDEPRRRRAALARRCRTRRTARRRRRGRGRRRSSTTIAFLPPSSSDTSLGPVSIAAAATARPVGTEPVKLTRADAGVHGERGAGLAEAVHDLDELARARRRRRSASTNASAHAGACSDGLITMPLPASSAGKHFHDGIATGKFHGVIIPTTPTGWRVVHAILSGSSDGTRLAPRGAALAGDERGHVDRFLHVAARLDEHLAGLAADELGELAPCGRRARRRHAAMSSARAGIGTRGPRPLRLASLHRRPRSTSAAVAAVNVPRTSAGRAGLTESNVGHHLIVSR